MARPRKANPTPRLQKRGDSYRIRWTALEQNFSFTLGPVTKQEAEDIRAALTAALAKRIEMPPEFAAEPTIKRYLALQQGITDTDSDDALINKYISHMRANSGSSWHMNVKAHLRTALVHMGKIRNATPTQILEFLDETAATKSNATRNRAKNALSGFFRFLRNTDRMSRTYNPMENIKLSREERPHDGIIIWEEQEVQALLQAADTRRDGIAVWIAILAGLRRGEIARLAWPDITPAYILVGKSKTGVKRQVPLSTALANRLEKEPHKTGRVVPWPEARHGWETAARRMVELHLPKRLPDLYKTHPEKFGWNPFRHTFASRHAQTGLSLDIIAAWLGDSPKVCKEHYARYVPKSVRDTRIDAADPKI